MCLSSFNPMSQLTYYMDDSKFQQLVQDNPDLFEKCDEEYFGIGNGWYNIVRILCGYMSHDVNQARYRLNYALKNPEAKMPPIAELEAILAKAIEDLPRIEQVKEKFGSLRFYVANSTPEIDNYIAFAEAMSTVTCEECGAPGERRNDGWIKTLCDKHHKERAKDLETVKVPFSKTSPKLSDEE